MAAEPPSWSSIADWYDRLLTAGSGPHQTAIESIERLLPDVAGRRVVDIACGQGILSRHLADLGAFVVGLDAAEPMIELALGHGSPVGRPIEYRVDDAHHLGTVASASVDGVTCQLGLMDIEDLDRCLDAIGRVLRPRGWFVFCIGHPAFLAPFATTIELDDGRSAVAIADYFGERFWRSPNPCGVRRAGNHHRTLATYLNALPRHGFTLEQVDEPRANRLLEEQQPVYGQVPIFFSARARRAD